MRVSLLGVLGVGALFAAAACGGGGGDGGSGPNGAAGMSAKINANSWGATLVQVTAGSPQVPGSVIITGTRVSGSSTSSISLLLGFIAGPGTYPLGVNQGTSAGGTGLLLETTPASAENRTTPFTGAGGTVVITSLSATHLTGTFAFVAEPILGSTFTGNKEISDGVLDIDLPKAITAVPAANHGSSVSANLGGTPFNAATVVGLGSAGSFSFGGNSDSLNLSFVTATPVTATGTYPFLTGFRLSLTDHKKNHNWGGVSGDVGSVIVTSVANGRVAGTFSGTLHSLSQGLADLTISNGSFDVRIDPSP